MAEHDWLPAAPILVENLDAIAGGDTRHFPYPSRELEIDASDRNQLPDTAAAGD
jgi:hypothetical protein